MIKKLIIILLLFSFTNTNNLLALTRIAILPFEQNNLQNTYLIKSITDLLISRLSRPNEFEVSEINYISPKDSLAKTADTLKKSNIDYFIKGKLIQTNKLIQIDLYLFNVSTLQPESHLKYHSDNLNELINEINRFSLDITTKVKNETKSIPQPRIEITKISADTSERPVLLNIPEPNSDLAHRIHPDKLLATKETTTKQSLDKTFLKEKLKSKLDDSKDRPELITIESEKKLKIEENKSTKPIEFFTEKERLKSNLQIKEDILDNQQRPILTLEKNSPQKEVKKLANQNTKITKNITPSSDLPYPSPYELKPIGKNSSQTSHNPFPSTTPKDSTHPTDKSGINYPINIKTP